jgi:hypothetical protein
MAQSARATGGNGGLIMHITERSRLSTDCENSCVEIVRSIMETSDFGGLAELFVLDALWKWSEKIAECDPRLFDSSVVTGTEWVGVAKEIKGKLDAIKHALDD